MCAVCLLEAWGKFSVSIYLWTKKILPVRANQVNTLIYK